MFIGPLRKFRVLHVQWINSFVSCKQFFILICPLMITSFLNIRRPHRQRQDLQRLQGLQDR